MNEISIVCLFNGEKEYIPLIHYNYNLIKSEYKSELIIVDFGNQDLSSEFLNEEICYLYLSRDEKQKYMEEIFKNKEQNKENIQLKYLKKMNDLPSGFLRDYGVGMSNYDIIFHMNYDCIYTKNTIIKKMNYLKKNIECVFCDSMLTYDIDKKVIGKTESKNKIYEGTLLHTREFWKRGGFEWEVNYGEGRYFHYNKGLDRKQENYYDCIQIIHSNNNMYHNVKELKLENHKVDIPELIHKINIIQINTLDKWLTKLYPNNIVNPILGYQSKSIDLINTELKYNLLENIKQKKISNEILKISNNFSIFFFNGKYPIWDLFESVSFDIIFFETSKNNEQMESILLNCKKYKYQQINTNIYFNENFLNN